MTLKRYYPLAEPMEKPYGTYVKVEDLRTELIELDKLIHDYGSDAGRESIQESLTELEGD